MEVVFSEGTKGLRYDWWSGQRYYEELEISKDAIRMGRMKNGAPVLKDHAAYSIDNVIGVVESARVQDGQAIAKIRLSNSEDKKAIVDEIKSGIVRKVSVGYHVHKYVKEEKRDGEIPVWRATDWEPVEISFVCVPFDDAAQSRDNTDFSECLIIENRGEQMAEGDQVQPKENLEPAPAAPAVEAPAPAPVEAPAPAPVAEAPAAPEVKAEDAPPPADNVASQESEGKRVEGILELTSRAKLPVEVARELIVKKLSLEDAEKEIRARWAKEGENQVQIDNKVSVGEDHKRVLFSEGLRNALNHRIDSKVELKETGRHFRGLSLMEMGREVLEYHGVKTRGMSKMEVAQLILSDVVQKRTGYQTTDDFPHILLDAANKTLRQSYDQAPQTFRPFVRVVKNADFKNINRVQLGEAPSLQLIGEHGETTYGAVGESKETYTIKRYGRIVPFTYEAMVNDDLDAFSRVPRGLGFQAANLESDLVYGILTANAAMGDSVALFHSSHSNLTNPGTAISDTSLGVMRKVGRVQTGIDGATKLNIMFKYLIVPAALETLAQKYLAVITPNASSSVNPFAGAFQLVVEPRLDADSVIKWYGAADPAQIDVIEMAYLDGQESVYMNNEVDFDTRGLKLRAEHAVGVKAIDHRGLYRNDGA